jgi:hypothetical protein
VGPRASSLRIWNSRRTSHFSSSVKLLNLQTEHLSNPRRHNSSIWLRGSSKLIWRDPLLFWFSKAHSLYSLFRKATVQWYQVLFEKLPSSWVQWLFPDDLECYCIIHEHHEFLLLYDPFPKIWREYNSSGEPIREFSISISVLLVCTTFRLHSCPYECFHDDPIHYDFKTCFTFIQDYRNHSSISFLLDHQLCDYAVFDGNDCLVSLGR